jgi:hypothetical protein
MNGRNFKLSISNMRFYIFTRMVWKFKLSGLIFVMDSIYRSPYAIGSHRSLFFFLPSGLRVKQRYRVHVQACCFAFALPSHQLPEFIFFFLQSHLALLRTPFSDPLFRTPFFGPLFRTPFFGPPFSDPQNGTILLHSFPSTCHFWIKGMVSPENDSIFFALTPYAW